MKKIYKDLEYIITILFLSQHNCFCNRLVVYKQAYDIGQEGIAPYTTHHTASNIPYKSFSQKSKYSNT